jgi:hypothetical protein
MNKCENCGTKLQGRRCPNCHEELIILDQYQEQGMNPPSDDSEFMRKVRLQESVIKKKKDT